MAKAVVRFSLNSDAKSATRNAIVNELETAFSTTVTGFRWMGTGLYEAGGLTTAEALGRIKTVFDLLSASGAAQLDHLFVYVTQEE